MQFTETEREEASNAYLMGIINLVAGAPLPILNLLAGFIYHFSIKTDSYFVRFHKVQAIVSQLWIIPFNSVLLGWTIRIVYTDWDFATSYFIYLIIVIVLNILELIQVVYLAQSMRNGKHIEIPVVKDVVKFFLKK